MTLTTWRKSSFSSDSQGDCIEVAWRKSSFSIDSDGDCVELAFRPDGVAVRDSKNATGPMLTVDLPGWRALTRSLTTLSE
jgi:hypothetical protein